MNNRILALTNPHMRGADVKALQLLLNGEGSPYGDFLRGSSVDGEYGPYTAQAVRRAKYALGYAKPDQRAGEKLVGFLSGKTPLSTAMRARRSWRLKRVATARLRLRALARIEAMVGQMESPPGSNRCPVSVWYGIIGPWCAMTVSKAYVEAGSVAFARSRRYHNCYAIIGDARAGRNGLSLTKTPLPGDLVFFRWPGSRWEADHVGIVKRADAGALITIEGNTSPDKAGSQDNGGMCCRKDRTDERRAGIVVLYVRVSK